MASAVLLLLLPFLFLLFTDALPVQQQQSANPTFRQIFVHQPSVPTAVVKLQEACPPCPPVVQRSVPMCGSPPPQTLAATPPVAMIVSVPNSIKVKQFTTAAAAERGERCCCCNCCNCCCCKPCCCCCCKPCCCCCCKPCCCCCCKPCCCCCCKPCCCCCCKPCCCCCGNRRRRWRPNMRNVARMGGSGQQQQMTQIASPIFG